MKTAKKKKAGFKIKLVLLAAFLIYAGFSIYTQQINIDELQSQNEGLEQQYEQVQDELARLEHQSEYINTQNYIENTARDKLGMVYSDEIILEPEE